MNRALWHGYSTFTTIRCRFGVPLLWAWHWARLIEGCRLLGLTVPDPSLHLAAIAAQPYPEGRYRLMVTEVGDSASYQPLASVADTSVQLWRSDWQVHPQLAQYKTGNYLPYALAAQEAQQHGCFEALMCNPSDHIVDASRSGLLAWHAEQHSYICPVGGLASTTRAAWVELLQQAGARVQHSVLTWESLAECSHLWILGAGIGLLAVDAVHSPQGSLLFTQGHTPRDADFLRPPQT